MKFAPVIQLLALAAAINLHAAPALPESLDPARETGRLQLLEGETRLEVGPDVSGGVHVRWIPGDLWQIRQQDGCTRYLFPGDVSREATGQPLLPSSDHLLEIPRSGAVRLVVDELRLRPLEDAKLGLGRAEEQLNASSDGDRAPLELNHADTADLIAATGNDLPALLGEPVIFRDLRLVSLQLHPVIVQEGRAQVVESLTLRLVVGPEAESTPVQSGLLGAERTQVVSGNELVGPAHAWSENMESIYKSLVRNHGQFYTQVDESVFPVYLITGSPNYLNNPTLIADFVKWKREKGYDVRIVPFNQIPGGGTTISFGALRNWVRQQWQDLRPEYLLLIGDGDGVAACPDSVVRAHTGDLDVSDHFYSLHEGEDYFPELFVGRFSVDTPQQLYVMAQKPVVHEKYPNLAGSGWLTKGLVVSCNYSDAGVAPISPNQTSRWVIDKLRANGFTLTAQDSIFYPPVTDGGGPISSALNQGRGIVSYRGWANSNGWIYPAFDRDDVEALTNVMKMPIVGSFVCQTGAWGGGSPDVVVEDPCFGEKLVRLGNPGEPRGAVAFVGPSDLHTRTQYNNPVCSGFFNAIFDLDITSIGPALLNGKMELYRGYPLERTDPYSSYFYFHIYNVLGDPDLKIWRDDPAAFDVQAPTQLLPGQTVLEIDVADAADGSQVDAALVTLTAGDDGSILLARGQVQNGHILLTLDPEQLTLGLNAVLTVNHIDFVPFQRDLTVSAATEAVELSALDVTEETVDGQYRAGELLEVRLALTNTGTAGLPAGTAVLRNPVEWPILPDFFTVLVDSIGTPALVAGGAATTAEAFQIRLAQDVPNSALLHLVADLNAGTYSGLADGRLTVSNMSLELVSTVWRSGAAQLLAGQIDTLDLVLRNNGAFALSGATLVLASADQRVNVEIGEGTLPALAIGEEAAASFVLIGRSNLFTGQVLHVQLSAGEAGRQAELSIPLPVGAIQPEDPLGPDAWGYYAIESEDFDVHNHPAYDWIELDPFYGGSGATRLILRDDAVTTIDLPFPVTHYGRTSSRLSICSNGWVSLGDTWIDDFRNWNLPSSLGPPSLICAFWDDLKPQYHPDSVHVPVFWRHDAAAGRVVVSWSRTYNRYNWTSAGQPKQEFQLVLYDQGTRPTPTGDTDVLVQFKDVTNLDQDNNFATCGMENFGHDIGIQVSYANQSSPGCFGFGSGRSVLFTTSEPHHESAIRVRIVEPLSQQWLLTRRPVIHWNHEAFVQLVESTDVTYTVTIGYEGGSDLLVQDVAATGELDLDVLGMDLPEGVALRLDLTAVVDGIQYESVQGRTIFYVDATPPALTTALLESDLLPGHLELGVLSNEPLASLVATAADQLGEQLAILTQDEGQVLLQTGQELRYLRTQLHQDYSVLRIHSTDLHGLESSEELPMAVAEASAGILRFSQLDQFELGWSASASGWAVLLARTRGGDARLLDMGAGVHQVEWRVPATSSPVLRCAVPEGAVVVQQRDGSWWRLPQERVGGQVMAHPLGTGPLGMMQSSDVAETMPESFRLLGNYPNPFNPETWIEFELPASGRVQAEIYNLGGALVRQLESGELSAGTHRVRWDGRSGNGVEAASGLYLVRLEWKNQARVHRMLLVR